MGTARGFRLIGKLSKDALAGDIEAVDRNVTLRIVSLFRATYGSYPKRFSQRMLDLSPDGIVVRPYWSDPRRRVFRVAEEIIDARVRPRNPKTDWNIRATGVYAEGGVVSHIGSEVITCRTELGTLEFAVIRPDVPLMLHYINHKRHA